MSWVCTVSGSNSAPAPDAAGLAAALGDGVERAKESTWPKPSLDLAYYGDVFLAKTDNKGGPQDPEALDDDLVAFFTDVQGEVVDPSQPWTSRTRPGG
jgi:hypothetical protein